MVLYGMEVGQQKRSDWGLARFWSHFGDGAPLDPAGPWDDFAPEAWSAHGMDDVAKAYTERLVRGVEEHREALRGSIQSASLRWRFERMALVDRCVLLLGAYELAHVAEVPPRVAINESIELAKCFGAKEAGAFINGILDKIGRASSRAV